MQLLPHYIHKVNPKLKHTYLSFDDEGTLVIKSPKVSQKYIEKLLIQKASWIHTSKNKMIQKRGKKLNFKNNPEIYFLGEAHLLELIPHNKKRTRLDFDGDIFRLYYSHYDEAVFQAKIDTFYKKEAKNYIPDILDTWAKKMKLSYNQLSFRKTKRQWGSCSSKNNLSFNTMMMKLPLAVIEYIIIHELAHISYKHHKKDFWNLVEAYMPDYKAHVSELKKYTT